jgi:hypothetical protein
MPTLDVNDAFDPSFMDTIVVVRRVQQINSKGRVQLVETARTVGAVVVAATPNDLERVPEQELMQKSIRVTSPQFRLQGPAIDEVGSTTLPDQILWHGSMFVVVALEDYSGYGRGFTSAICTSMSQPDPSIMPSPMGNA